MWGQQKRRLLFFNRQGKTTRRKEGTGCKLQGANDEVILWSSLFAASVMNISTFPLFIA